MRAAAKAGTSPERRRIRVKSNRTAAKCVNRRAASKGRWLRIPNTANSPFHNRIGMVDQCSLWARKKTFRSQVRAPEMKSHSS